MMMPYPTAAAPAPALTAHDGGYTRHSLEDAAEMDMEDVATTPTIARAPRAGRLAPTPSMSSMSASRPPALDRRVPAAERRRRRSPGARPAVPAQPAAETQMLIETMIRASAQSEQARRGLLAAVAEVGGRRAAGGDEETSDGGDSSGDGPSRPRRTTAGSHPLRGRGAAKRSTNDTERGVANKRRATLPKSQGPRKRTLGWGGGCTRQTRGKEREVQKAKGKASEKVLFLGKRRRDITFKSSTTIL